MGSFEHTGVIESADLDQHSRRRALRACAEMDTASLAEMSGGRSRAIIFIEGPGSPFGELEALSVNGHVGADVLIHFRFQGIEVSEDGRRMIWLLLHLEA